MGTGAHVEHGVALAHGGMQEGPRCAHPTVLVDRALEIADAVLLGAVVIGVAGNAEADGAFDECLAERVAVGVVGYDKAALAAAEGVVALADALLGAPEIGQHVGIAPAPVAALGPAIVVEALAAIVDMAVDRARPAERLAARRVDAPAAGPFAGFGGIKPVHRRVRQRLHEAGRDVDEGMAVRRSGLKHADGMDAACGEPGGQHRARRAGADDHIVEAVDHGGGTIEQPLRCAMSRPRDIAAYRTATGKRDKPLDRA